MSHEMTIEEKTMFVRGHWQAYINKGLSAADQQIMQDIICNCDYTFNFMGSLEKFDDKIRQVVKEGCTDCPDTLADRISIALDSCEQELRDDSKPDASSETDDNSNGEKQNRFPWFPAVLMALAAALVVAVATFGGIAGSVENSPHPSLEQVLVPLVANADFSVPMLTIDQCKYPEIDRIRKEQFRNAPEMPLMINGERCIVSGYTQAKVDGNNVLCAVYDRPNGKRFALMIMSCDCLDEVMPNIVKSQEVIMGNKNVVFWRTGEYVQVLVNKGDLGELRSLAHDIRLAT